jgi:hypothetical protein
MNTKYGSLLAAAATREEGCSRCYFVVAFLGYSQDDAYAKFCVEFALPRHFGHDSASFDTAICMTLLILPPRYVPHPTPTSPHPLLSPSNQPLSLPFFSWLKYTTFVCVWLWPSSILLLT